MTMSLDGKGTLLKITAVFPLKNQVELYCSETESVFYFRFFAHQSVQSQVKVGDFFLIKGTRFQVLKKNRNKVRGLSGSVDLTQNEFQFAIGADSL